MKTYKWRECELLINLYNNQFVCESFETEAVEIIKIENLSNFIKNKKVRYENTVVAAAVEAAVKAAAAERAAAVKAAIEATVETIEEAPAEEAPVVPAPRKRMANGWQPGDWFCYNNDGISETTQLNRKLRPESHGNSKAKTKRCFNRKHRVTKQKICFTMWSEEE